MWTTTGLTQQVITDLLQIERQSRDSARKGASMKAILAYLARYSIEPETARLLFDTEPPITPETLADLVNLCTSIPRVITLLESSIRRAQILKDNDSDIINVDILRDMRWVLEAFHSASKTKRTAQNKSNFSYPFCCLCYRIRSTGSVGYCRSHAADKSLRERDIRRLHAYVRQRADEHSRRLDRFETDGLGDIYNMRVAWLKLLAPEARLVPTGQQEYYKAIYERSWRQFAKHLQTQISKIFPNAHSKISDITPSDYQTFSLFLQALQFKLDDEAEKSGAEVAEWVMQIDEDEFYCFSLLESALRKYEAYVRLRSMTDRSAPGPKVGTVPRNCELRDKIQNLLKRQHNLSQIARELGISRQRVWVIVKETRK